MQTFQTRDIDGNTLAFHRTQPDAANPVLMLHGLGDSSLMTFAPFFAPDGPLAHIPALLIDFPGFGYSTASPDFPATVEAFTDVLAHVLDSFDIAHAGVVAHSMGGSIAIDLATRYPNLVADLIVAEALLEPRQSKLADSVARRSADAWIERGHDMLISATRRQAARGDAAAQNFLEPLKRANPVVTHRVSVSLLEERSPSFGEMLCQLPGPSTFLIGERTDEPTDALTSAGVSVVTIPDAGHAMMSENPAAFANAVGNAVSRGGGA